MRACRRTAGFTLLELLVAVALMAILAVLSWRGLDSVLASREHITAHTDETRAIYDGMALCAEYEDAFDVDDIPTPVPTPTALLDIIEVF
mgnify:CR=1 FL=1